MPRTIRISLVLLCLAPSVAKAQFNYSAAEGSTSLVSTESSTVSVDFKETAFSYLYKGGALTIGEGKFWDLKTSLAAEKGKRTLFARGEFVPGAEVTARHVWIHNSQGSAGGWRARYLTAGLDAVRWKTVDGDGGTVPFTFEEKTSASASLGAGLNWAPAENVGTVGMNAIARWRRDAPRAEKPEQVFVESAAGQTAGGMAAVIGETEERFVGGTADDRVLDTRVDVLTPRLLIGFGDKNADRIDQASVAGLAAVSARAKDGRGTVYSVAFGPALFAPGQATKVIGAFLFELSDITNVSGKTPTVTEQLSARLYVGFPLK